MKSIRSILHALLPLALLALTAAQSACAPSAPSPTSTPVATGTSLPTEPPLPSATPVPTDTPTPTATPTPDTAATQAAQATAAMQKQIERIAPDLEDLGFNLDSGSLVWSSDQPIELSTSAYLEMKRKRITQADIADFVLVTDVKWNTTSGLAGCSVIFRAGEDLDYDPNYVFPILRLQNAPAWDIEYFNYGKWQQTLTSGGAQFSPAIKDMNDDVNRLTLVVQGDQIKPYINRDPLMQVTANKLAKGQIGFEAFQESGKTTCTFSNGWIWALNP